LIGAEVGVAELVVDATVGAGVGDHEDERAHGGEIGPDEGVFKRIEDGQGGRSGAGIELVERSLGEVKSLDGVGRGCGNAEEAPQEVSVFEFFF